MNPPLQRPIALGKIPFVPVYFSSFFRDFRLTEFPALYLFHYPQKDTFGPISLHGQRDLLLGISSNPERRLHFHNNVHQEGYTQHYLPCQLAFTKVFTTKEEALVLNIDAFDLAGWESPHCEFFLHIVKSIQVLYDQAVFSHQYGILNFQPDRDFSLPRTAGYHSTDS